DSAKSKVIVRNACLRGRTRLMRPRRVIVRQLHDREIRKVPGLLELLKLFDELRGPINIGNGAGKSNVGLAQIGFDRLDVGASFDADLPGSFEKVTIAIEERRRALVRLILPSHRCFDIFAVDAEGLTMREGVVPQKTATGVGERITAVVRITS